MPKETFFNLPEEKRHQILELAIDEFAANNYRQASISRIVEKAGIAKGSFYQYFEDKRDLYLYLLELAAEEKVAFMRQLEPADPDLDVFSYLLWLFDASLGFQFSNPGLAQVGYRALQSEGPLAEEAFKRMGDTAGRFYQELIARGIRQGDVRPEVDADLAAFVIGTAMNNLGDYVMQQLGMTLEEYSQLNTPERQKHRTQTKAILTRLVDMLRNGLG